LLKNLALLSVRSDIQGSKRFLRAYPFLQQKKGLVSGMSANFKSNLYAFVI